VFEGVACAEKFVVTSRAAFSFVLQISVMPLALVGYDIDRPDKHIKHRFVYLESLCSLRRHCSNMCIFFYVSTKTMFRRYVHDLLSLKCDIYLTFEQAFLV
jgi:hypothetical protein